MGYVKVKYDPIPCMWCSEVFSPNRRDKKFCCPTCRKLYGKKYKNHSWGNVKEQRKRANKKARPYTEHKSTFCNHCGFVALHSCQLDVDHIDGNHNNNDVDNLQTLCANCHRLKTALQLNW